MKGKNGKMAGANTSTKYTDQPWVQLPSNPRWAGSCGACPMLFNFLFTPSRNGPSVKLTFSARSPAITAGLWAWLHQPLRALVQGATEVIVDPSLKTFGQSSQVGIEVALCEFLRSQLLAISGVLSFRHVKSCVATIGFEQRPSSLTNAVTAHLWWVRRCLCVRHELQTYSLPT